MDEKTKAELWRRRFFEAQASAEEFIVSSYGYAGIDQWIDANAKITARLLRTEEPEQGKTVGHFATRLLNQLTLYDSRVVHRANESGYQLENQECGILRYRKAAEGRGVRLTFATPCDYCQRLNSGIYREYTGKTAIACQLNESGCVWSIADV